MGQVTLKNLPQLKRLTSRYTKKQPGTDNASDAVEVMGEGRVVLENLPALETVQLNGTSLLNAGEPAEAPDGGDGGPESVQLHGREL